MISDVLGAPVRSDDAAGTLLVGSLLLLFSVVFPVVWVYAIIQSPLWLILGPLAVFPPLIALGYDVRVLEAGARERETIPSFVDWTGLVRTGLLSLVVRAAYLLPLALFVAVGGAVGFGIQAGAFGLSPDTANLVVAGVVLLGALFALFYLAGYLYVRPAALAVFAVTGSVRSALSVRQAIDVAFSRDYAVGWTVAGAILLVGLLIAAPLQLLLVGFAIAFYVRAAAYVAYGRGATDALSSMGLVGEQGNTAEATETVAVERDVPPAVQTGRGVGGNTDEASETNVTDATGETDDQPSPSDANKPAADESTQSTDGDRGFDFDREPDGADHVAAEAETTEDASGGAEGADDSPSSDDRQSDQRSGHTD